MPRNVVSFRRKAIGREMQAITQKKRGVGFYVAATLGVCVLAPVIAAIGWEIAASMMQKSDSALYDEIVGQRPLAPEQTMLFDDFGHGPNREIYMRIFPSDAERSRLLSLPGIRPSVMSIDQFISRGNQHGFTWWVSADPTDAGYCNSARILEADGFRGWTQLRIAECLDNGREIVPPNSGQIHIIAWHRAS